MLWSFSLLKLCKFSMLNCSLNLLRLRIYLAPKTSPSTSGRMILITERKLSITVSNFTWEETVEIFKKPSIFWIKEFCQNLLLMFLLKVFKNLRPRRQGWLKHCPLTSRERLQGEISIWRKLKHWRTRLRRVRPWIKRHTDYLKKQVSSTRKLLKLFKRSLEAVLHNSREIGQVARLSTDSFGGSWTLSLKSQVLKLFIKKVWVVLKTCPSLNGRMTQNMVKKPLTSWLKNWWKSIKKLKRSWNIWRTRKCLDIVQHFSGKSSRIFKRKDKN